MNRFHQFISDVQSGRFPAGVLLKQAIDRHLTDLKRTDWGFYFDEKKAQHAVKFAELCRHWKGAQAGKRIKLEPHQVFRRALLYGWRSQDGTRRFTTSYYEVARKNAKTTEAAIDALYHILFEEKSGAQIFAGATKEAQARIVVNDIGQIALMTPELKDKFEYYYYKGEVTRVVYKERASYITPLGKDSRRNDGFDPSMGIMDEYHAHPTDEVMNIVESGMAARANRLINIITTAGFHKESPCFRMRKTCTDMLAGLITHDRLLAVIYSMDEGDDWRDPANWLKTNPNLNVSVREEYLSDRMEKALVEGGEKEVDFITKNLNVWMDASMVWIPDAKWQACGSPMPDLSGAVCYGGLDLAKYLDINAFALWFPEHSYLLAYFWVPEAKLKDQKEADYRRWASDGWIRTCPGEVTDHEQVYRDIAEITAPYNLQGVAFDRALLYHTTIKALNDASIMMVEHGQRYMETHQPTLLLQEKIISGELKHNNNPVMRWMLANVVITRDSVGNMKPDKAKSANKIDGIVAAMMALGIASRDLQQAGTMYSDWSFDEDF